MKGNSERVLPATQHKSNSNKSQNTKRPKVAGRPVSGLTGLGGTLRASPHLISEDTGLQGT